MGPAEGTAFERFGETTEVDAVESLLAGYATGNDTVKEASFHAFINGNQQVAAIGRDAIARLAQADPWVAAEFTFNLMAESQNFHYGDSDSLRGLDPDDCWDMAATSVPYASVEATHELAKGFCVLMDQERKFIGTLAQCNNVAASALRNGCAPETVQLVVHRGVEAIQKEDERLVNEDRRRVENFSKGMGSLWRKDPEAATRIQARIDAHIPGERIVDSIKGSYDHSSLEEYKFLSLLDITKMASVVGSEEDRSYLTSILKGVLGRLDSKEVKPFVPEIIDTYLALDEASQQTISTILAQKLKAKKVAGISDMNEATLREVAKRHRDERYEYGNPDPEYYKPSLPTDTQLFWPGDVVEMLDTSGYQDISGRPVHIESRQVIKDVSHNVYPQAEDEAKKHYETENDTSARANNLQLVERGELWKYCHGEITEFTDPKAAYDYAVRTVDYQFVNELDLSEKNKDSYFQRKYQEWRKEGVLEAIELGYADGFKMESRILVGGRDIVAVRFNDPKISQLIANSTLAGFGRQARQVAA
ncbi:MAG TPA: hypothetical protein PLT04_02405 [Candidatus Saccharibacteria bacterium]|nr:hypothetical protein [Candidatus Saccharibacteria bacterium]